jgi:histidinol-phosphate aminotransferase
MPQREKEMKYFRKNIDQMKPYVPGIQPKEKGWLKLNTNESPFPPSPKAIAAAMKATGGSLALYPDPKADEMRRTIAQIFRVTPEMVLVGNGSDEILSIIARAFLEKGKKALILHPTYSLFATIAEIQDAKIIRQKLNSDFTLPDEVFQEKADCAFISNPNPQAGTLFSRHQMERIARNIGGILVIDEAYADFAPRNCLALVKKYRNVIVTRTLSKSYSLAGMRIGFAIANKEIIDGLMKIKDSYNVNRLSQIIAIEALKDREYFKKNTEEIIRQRKFLTKALKILGFSVLPSYSNFILTKPPRETTAKRLYKELVARKVLIRYFDTKELRDYVRISIGSQEQNNDLLKAIKLSFIRFGVDYPETPFGVVKF